MEPRTFITRLALSSAKYVSHPWVVGAAFATVFIWFAAGWMLGFSPRWHNFIGSTTALITFVMVFFIQNAQDRNTQAIHLKLDELIRATEGAQNRLMALERESDETLEDVKAELTAACEDRDVDPPAGPPVTSTAASPSG